MKSVSKYDHFMGRYSDTNVEKSNEQNGGFYLRKEWLYFETNFSFKILFVCYSKLIHEITYSLFF